MKKKCFRCLRMLPKSEFYPHPGMSDGLLGKCRDCTRDDSKTRRLKKMGDPIWREREKQRMREKGLKANREYPEVATARRAVRSLGRSRDRHWHHWSYLKEHHLDVFNLSPTEHRRAHRYMIYDRERMQYRRTDTMELLDSRIAHQKYLKLLSRKSL